MLRSLRIRNLVIVEDLTVEFGSGLNLLTGETGAGKSIVVDALGLVVGRRADRTLVRSGESSAVVEALFTLQPDAGAVRWLADRGFDGLEGDELVVRRSVSSEGESRAWLNGSPCTQRLLRELGAELLELHGQHEHQTLLAPERHLQLLDRWGNHSPLLQRVEAAFEAVANARAELERRIEESGRRDERAERLQQTIREIESVAPEVGELARLEGDRSRLRNAEALTARLDAVIAQTYEGDRTAGALAAKASRVARELAELDPALGELATRLGSAAVELEDIGAAFRDYRLGNDFDTRRLDEVESRRAALERLLLRFGEDEAAVLATAEEARVELAGLAELEQSIERSREVLAKAHAAYLAAAKKLTAARKRAAKAIVPALADQLGSLALAGAEIDVALRDPRPGSTLPGNGGEVALSRSGAERAEFLLAANPGEPFRPLARVASGGELSRVMLALHGVLDAGGDGRTFVFDEVDSGVGGAVADAVGSRLAAVAEHDQVLCVTHLPQVAAYASRHLLVRKETVDGRTRAEVRALSTDDRVEELARMLGGKRATAASRRHAHEMLTARPPSPDAP